MPGTCLAPIFPMLRERHGQPLDQFWKSQFGYGLDCLTEAESLS